jgi:Putative phage abortive infection protein
MLQSSPQIVCLLYFPSVNCSGTLSSMSTELTNPELMDQEKRLKTQIWWCLRIAWACVLVGIMTVLYGVVYYYYRPHVGGDLNALGTLGSYLQGATGSCFALAGILLIYVAFLGQRLQLICQQGELKHQREQLQLNRQELEDQRQQLEDQVKTLQRQNFEYCFFQMLSLHHQITATVTAKVGRQSANGASEVIVGRESFEFCYAVVKRLYSEFTSESRKQLSERERVEQFFSKFFKSDETSMGNYFRHLCRIVEFIKESEMQNKGTYAGLVRAQLSDSALVILFYNGISSNAARLKLLIEEFGLLTDLNDSSLLKPEHKDYYAPSA